jgi:hypothetical protein
VHGRLKWLLKFHARWLPPVALVRKAGQQMMTLTLKEMAQRVLMWQMWTGGTWMIQSSHLQQQPSL